MNDQYRVQDIISVMEELAPADMAESWDHVGLMIGDASAQIDKCMLALDANHEAIEACKAAGATMLVTHHPLLFAPIHTIDFQEPMGKNIRDIILNGIHVYAAHSNLDKVQGGVNTALARELGLLMPMTLEGAEIGVCGSLGNDILLRDYTQIVKSKLGTSGIILNTDQNPSVSRAFVQGGAFDESAIPILKLARVDVVVTGEMKHHHMLELEESGISVIIAGHESTERVVLPYLQKILKERLPKLSVEVFRGHNW
ncbi:MAG TPA: Nif3-like dinuclear metal center hexameric protein [Bacillota bacterium]|nr:Nif3-like dinuclear metal center hexameric protein [Bacillota bacterium]HPE39194.1 Nif3-like dinuclear metal center hexameric protein [Bacillota bacterium]